MAEIFNAAIYQPLYNILILLYNVIPGQDFGVAIIATTIFLKFLLVPVSKKQIESQKKLQELQPKIKEIQNKHKDNKEKQTKELMAFYKENKANPLSGCLPLIVQLIFLIAIYRILINISMAGLVVDASNLYSFVADPGKINDMFIGLVDLNRPNVVLAVLAAIAQYFQTKMIMKKNKNENKNEKTSGKPDFASMMSKQMLYLGPFLTLFIGLKFAAGLALYWLVSTLFMIGQQMYIAKGQKRE